MKVRFKLLNDKAVMPRKAHPTDAGFDLVATQDCTIAANGRALIDTGVAMEIPEGYWGMVTGRSGNTIKRGLVGMVGVIDSHYRNAIGIMAFNLTDEDICIKAGDRVGQFIPIQLVPFEFEQADELEASDRGMGGYGSTGR